MAFTQASPLQRESAVRPGARRHDGEGATHVSPLRDGGNGRRGLGGHDQAGGLEALAACREMDFAGLVGGLNDDLGEAVEQLAAGSVQLF